jgi:predicted nuclease of predicted toxin-antitoxin system
VRYLLDEDISPAVAEGLRRRSIDAVSVHDLGRANQGVADATWLEEAATDGRVVVTYNQADFQALDEQWRAAGRMRGGILWASEQIIPRRAIGGLIRALVATGQQFTTLEGLCVPLLRATEGASNEE